jgi:general stress protein 26
MDVKLKAEKMLRHARFFILCAVDAAGFPTAKAVLPSKRRSRFDDMYFVTNTHSDYVKNIQRDPKVSVYYYNALLFKGTLLKGTMEIIQDAAIKASVWKNSYKSAYPEPEKKYEDPDFCVLKFIPGSGRYYSLFKTADFDI